MGEERESNWENQRDCGQRHSKVIKVMGVYIHILETARIWLWEWTAVYLESKSQGTALWEELIWHKLKLTKAVGDGGELDPEPGATVLNHRVGRKHPRVMSHTERVRMSHRNVFNLKEQSGKGCGDMKTVLYTPWLMARGNQAAPTSEKGWWESQEENKMGAEQGRVNEKQHRIFLFWVKNGKDEKTRQDPLVSDYLSWHRQQLEVGSCPWPNRPCVHLYGSALFPFLFCIQHVDYLTM